MSLHAPFIPRDASDAAALDVARALDDVASLNVYLAFAKRYSPAQMYRTLALVKEVPNELIKKSRGAFFSWLIQRYEIPSLPAQGRRH